MKTLKVLLQEVVSGIKAWVNSNFAQESNTVHKTGNETVNGDKYLTGYIRHTLTYDCIQSTAFDVRTDPEANRGRDIFRFWEGDRSSLGDYLGGMSYYQETDGSSRLQLICFGYPTTGNPSQQRINFHAYRDGTSSFYPVRNDVNLGSSTYQWNNVYAKNYYYNGTAWGLDKANVWTGTNTFSGTTNCILFQKFGTSGSYNDIRWYDNIDENPNYACLRSKVNELVLGLKYSSATAWYNGSSINILNDGSVTIKSYDGTDARYTYFTNNAIYPSVSSVTDLGTSTKKWKTFNGINPGSLSFPSGGTTENTDWFNVAGDILPTGGTATNFSWQSNWYTPPRDGWLALTVNNCSDLTVWSSLNYGMSVPATGTSISRQVVIPVIAGVKYEIKINGTSWYSARLIMPKGNV